MKAESAGMLVFKDALPPRCRASLRTVELHPSWTACNLDVSPISGYERIRVYFWDDTTCRLYLPCLQLRLGSDEVVL